jgi:hypothetical protein
LVKQAVIQIAEANLRNEWLKLKRETADKKIINHFAKKIIDAL